MSEFAKENLTRAIIGGDLSFIHKYLQSGASLEEITLLGPDDRGHEPLKLAAMAEVTYGGSADITKVILENASLQQQGEVLNFFASEDRYLELAEALLRAGIKPDILYRGQTALQLAVGNGNPKMVYLLLCQGADPSVPGKYGTAIESARHDPVLEAMLESAVRGEIKSAYYFTDLESIKTRLIIWTNAIQKFAAMHKDQQFYVFAVEGLDLVANSEAAFEKTLAHYRKILPNKYANESAIKNLRFSAGDFSFRFDDFPRDEVLGGDIQLDFSFLNPQPNEQRTEKQLLIEGLNHNRKSIFSALNITEDFVLRAFGHVY